MDRQTEKKTISPAKEDKSPFAIRFCICHVSFSIVLLVLLQHHTLSSRGFFIHSGAKMKAVTDLTCWHTTKIYHCNSSFHQKYSKGTTLVLSTTDIKISYLNERKVLWKRAHINSPWFYSSVNNCFYGKFLANVIKSLSNSSGLCITQITFTFTSWWMYNYIYFKKISIYKNK